MRQGWVVVVKVCPLLKKRCKIGKKKGEKNVEGTDSDT
jgi:hypothetical protein